MAERPAWAPARRSRAVSGVETPKVAGAGLQLSCSVGFCVGFKHDPG